MARSQETRLPPLFIIAFLNTPDGEASSMSNLLLSSENFLISGFGTDTSAPSEQRMSRFIYFKFHWHHTLERSAPIRTRWGGQRVRMGGSGGLYVHPRVLCLLCEHLLQEDFYLQTYTHHLKSICTYTPTCIEVQQQIYLGENRDKKGMLFGDC